MREQARRCPECGYYFSMKRFLGLKTMAFTCPDCGASLRCDLASSLPAYALMGVLGAFVVRAAWHTPLLWLGLIPAGLLSVLVHYLFFTVRPAYRP